ncbi:TolB-like 6-bladed beta-propeller domain-containing protein [Parabacteroides sp. OttesenSCG-928-G07]|nr:TolB-like 6-bladed beta-propeller domain-containing protein [Parabacteroides sp. OttesenSCG-928-G07]
MGLNYIIKLMRATMRKYIYILFVLIILSNCVTDKESPYEFSKVENISFNKIDYPDTLGVTLQLLKRDNLLIINDFYGDFFVSLFDLENKEIENRIIAKGNGPNELSSPLDLQFYGESLYVLSRPLFSLNHMEWDIIKNGSPVLYKDFQLPSKSDRFVVLNDSLFVFSGLWDKRYGYLNIKDTNDIREFGEYPHYWQEENNLSNEVKAMFHQCKFAKHPDKYMFASCSGYVFEIFSYDPVNNSLPNLIFRKQLGKYSYTYTDGNILRTKADEGSDPKVIDIACSEHYVYIITQSKEDKKKRNIMVLDWDGNPIKLLKSDKCIVCLVVDEDLGVGYCIIQDPEDTLVSFDLNSDY